MTTEKISSIIESVLFVSSESMNIKDIKSIFAESGEAEIGISDIINAVSHLKSKYSREE